MTPATAPAPASVPAPRPVPHTNIDAGMTTEPTMQSEPTALPAAMPSAPQPPSIHIRAVITWIAIFPLVALGMLALGPVFDPLHPVLRALILTLIVVPVAVYLVVPRLMAAYGRMAARRRR